MATCLTWSSSVSQVNDDSALSHSAKDALYKSYPEARRAHLKTGGNFPYLSRSNEVNLYIQVSVDKHVRDFSLQGDKA